MSRQMIIEGPSFDLACIAKGGYHEHWHQNVLAALPAALAKCARIGHPLMWRVAHPSHPGGFGRHKLAGT